MILSALALFFFSINATAQKSGELYDGTYVHDIRITFDQSKWMDLLDSNRINGDEMVIGKVQIDGTNYENVGISYAKNYTHTVSGKRNPWLLKLNLMSSPDGLSAICATIPYERFPVFI